MRCKYMERDSMVFYRSFMESMDDLEPEIYKSTMQMVLHYAMDGEATEGGAIERALFSLIKPQIDANNRKYASGKQGGRVNNQNKTKAEPKHNQDETKAEPKHNQDETKAEPKHNQDETKAEPKHNQDETKAEPKHNQDETKAEPNVNDNVNVNDNDLKNIYGHEDMTVCFECKENSTQQKPEEGNTFELQDGIVEPPIAKHGSISLDKSKVEYPKSFEQFWKVYPRRIGKGEAYKKYKARLNDGFSEHELITAAENYAKLCISERTPDNYIKHPKTFLSDSTPFTDYISNSKYVDDDQNGQDNDNPYAEWA